METTNTTNKKDLSAQWQDFFSVSESNANVLAEKGNKVHVIQSISSINLFYENVRNLVGYQQEQMLRRIAIERFLKRPTLVRLSDAEIANNLVRELIYSGYLQNDSVEDKTVEKVANVLNRYALLKNHFNRENLEFITGVESTEIESILSPRVDFESVIDIFYQIIHSHMKKMSAVAEGALLGALHRVFEKADVPTQRYYLLKKQIPEFFLSGVLIDGETIESFRMAVRKVNNELTSTYFQKYLVIAKKFYPIYYIVRGIVAKGKIKAEKIMQDPISIERNVTLMVSEYNSGFLDKLYRSVIKAIIFIFLTKMTMGLILEIPYDTYFLGHINYLPLFINLFTPPLLLLFSSSLVTIPGPNNAARLTELTKAVLYNPDDTQLEQIAYHRPSHRGGIGAIIMNIFYLLSFVIIFGGLILLLRLLDFNPVSAALFFFFLSTVSFFAFRIRRGADDLVVIEGHESSFAAAIDFLLLPFLTIGYQVSTRLDKANIFLFIFDFILEAPFKIVVQLLEQWLGFVRAKKDEMIS
jgi:hypothetical protein